MRKKNPLLIVLAACGGCLLLAVIIGVVLVSVAYHQRGGMIGSAMNIAPNINSFMEDIQNRNYTAASALVDPTVQQSLSADKIQHMEEAVEKKLGMMQGFALHILPVGGESQSGAVVYTYQCTVTYQRGTASADLTFRLQNNKNSKGLISGFTLEPDAQTHNQ